MLQVKQMLMSHSRCFAQTLSDVGRTDIIEHHIRLKPDARPVYRPGFKRFSQPELQFIEKEIQKQLVAGIIREEDGPWCAPVTLGMKKKWKLSILCGIYRSKCTDRKGIVAAPKY